MPGKFQDAKALAATAQRASFSSTSPLRCRLLGAANAWPDNGATLAINRLLDLRIKNSMYDQWINFFLARSNFVSRHKVHRKAVFTFRETGLVTVSPL